MRHWIRRKIRRETRQRLGGPPCTYTMAPGISMNRRNALHTQAHPTSPPPYTRTHNTPTDTRMHADVAMVQHSLRYNVVTHPRIYAAAPCTVHTWRASTLTAGALSLRLHPWYRISLSWENGVGGGGGQRNKQKTKTNQVEGRITPKLSSTYKRETTQHFKHPAV